MYMLPKYGLLNMYVCTVPDRMGSGVHAACTCACCKKTKYWVPNRATWSRLAQTQQISDGYSTVLTHFWPHLMLKNHARFFLKKSFSCIVFWLASDRPWDFFFMQTFLLSTLTPLFLPFSLSYFILAVPCASVWVNTLEWPSTFPIARLNGICFFLTVQLQVHNMFLGDVC